MIKSRPLYRPFTLDVSGRAHLVVTDQPELPEMVDLPSVDLEIFTVQTVSSEIEAPVDGNRRAFHAVVDLLAHLPRRLANDKIGLRIYAIGTEAFVWDVHNIARAAGLGSAEIHLTHAGSLRRRVYCAHCKTMSEDVTDNIVLCPGCGASLLVRDHFSRRLAAFMGVKVDAEIPGEIPAAESLYQ
ncbi:MAG: dimethylamine monooxygenase subunit DmmA family protein [Acidiphilium sp.]|nr:dimethylamine monooxygenase subunit DmmA family protein [Acidiphilium sp.]MDD4936210.1 dimethylamine monooxygenase subunit DmmA family protein [Acidiphilium sp.]